MTSRLPGIVRMEDAFIEIDKRIYFGLVEDGCGWIENRLYSRSTRAACAAIRMLSAAANDLTHLRETIIASHVADNRQAAAGHGPIRLAQL